MLPLGQRAVLTKPSTSVADPTMTPLRPEVRARSPALRPSTRSALRLATLFRRLTRNGGDPSFDDRDRAVPAAFDSDVVAMAEFGLPTSKAPSVTAYAAPPPSTTAVNRPAKNQTELRARMSAPFEEDRRKRRCAAR